MNPMTQHMMMMAISGGSTVPEAVSIWGKLFAYYGMQDTVLTAGNPIVDNFGTHNLVIASAGGSLTSGAGKVGNAITSSGSVNATTPTGSGGSGTAISFGFWCKSVSTTTALYIYNTWNGAGYGVSTGSSVAAKLRFLLTVGTTQQLTSATSYNDGAWHFVVCDWTSGAPMHIYIDNMAVADATSSNLSGTIVSGGNITAFAQSGPSSYWPGSLEQAFTCTSALTSGERAYLYNGGSGVSFSQLKADSGH